MCRLLGVVSSETTDFSFGLRGAPRSLSFLSPEHPDGWGLAVFSRPRADPAAAGRWECHKHPACAQDDERFEALAHAARGELLIAHIRKRTVGPIGPENTHPFVRGPWVFAHNGTVEDVAFLERGSSPERLAEIEGTTDSERLCAYLMTVLDEAGAASGSGAADEDRLDALVAAAVRRAIQRPGFGAANFLLSDGEVLFAFRFGRTLHLLERGDADPVVPARHSDETDATLVTPWSSRRLAILVASEAMTDEPWEPVDEGTLLRIDAGPHPLLRRLL